MIDPSDLAVPPAPTDWVETPVRPGGKWKRHLRIGIAEATSSPCFPGRFDRYGIYGVRQVPDGGWELRAQREGYRSREGHLVGESTVVADCDSNMYFWCPVRAFTGVRMFDPMPVAMKW